MNERTGFLNAILENPADDNPRLAYADWLREQPGAYDQAHGRFMAAGLQLHRAPEPEDGNEGPYYEAISEQNETAMRVVEVQAQHLLGWAPGTFAWDNVAHAPGIVTAAMLPQLVPAESRAARSARRRRPVHRHALTWDRGCVSEVRLPLATWAGWCVRLLHLCPIERVQLHEIYGLVIHVERAVEGGWCFRGELKLPKDIRSGQPMRLAETVLGTYPIVSNSMHTRGMMVRNAWDWTDLLVRHLRRPADDRWLGPAEWDDPHPADVQKAREGLGLD